ncbi:hypothetical protein [Halomonas elongata]|uniref:hypothetical protein n=1 Tax=Halomonas elongata TaxID=2746 RepID=UPI00186B9140|nr:hypothetical protein [Halomonas elongata]MBW5799013.1 hypothetical protein [Halomonas elongata]
MTATGIATGIIVIIATGITGIVTTATMIAITTAGIEIVITGTMIGVDSVRRGRPRKDIARHYPKNVYARLYDVENPLKMLIYSL